jgi:hypothetical protein
MRPHPLIFKKEVNGGELVLEGLLICTDASQERCTLIRIVVADSVASTVHSHNEIALDLTAEDGEIHLETLIRRFVHDVPCPRRRKRGGDFAEAPVGGLLGVDARRKRDATAIASRGKTEAGRALMLSHKASELRASATGRRTCVHGEELCVSLTCPTVPVQDELEVDRGIAVPEVTAVEAEAVRVHGVCGTPALDIAVAEEANLRLRAARDTAHKTGGFATCTVVDDLLRSDGECRRHFAEGEFDGEKKNAWIDAHIVVQIY